MKSSLRWALTAILLAAIAVDASPNRLLKGNEGRHRRRLGNLRNVVDDRHKKGDDPTASPSLSPTESPTCEKKCKENKATGDDDDDDDEKPITFAPTPSPQSSIEFAPTPAPAVASTTPEPTFTDDFVENTSSPTAAQVSPQTGEISGNTGIGVNVDVGGNENVVDVSVIITQNGSNVTVPSGDGGGGGDDFVVDDFNYDDYAESMSMSMSASMSASMSMGEDDFDNGGSYYGPDEEEEDGDDAGQDAAAADETQQDDEIEQDAAAELEDDFATFFEDPNANKKMDGPTEKEDLV
ncbi:hypothetical protein ACHAWX_006198 [Stephanocyclus meneghinianus]